MTDRHLLILVLGFLASFAVTLAVLPRFAHIASRIGLIDHPSARKVHRKPKPLVGGLGMFMGVALSGLLFIPLTHMRGFWVGTVLLVLAGFLDDFKEINHRWRFVVQIAAALFLIHFSKATLLSFGDLFGLGPLDLGALAIPVTVFCVVGVINAVNMIDGLDGLAGGLTVIAFLSFALLAHLNHQPELTILSVSFSGAVLAFLRHNWFPSSLFMGDAGSMLLGFALTFLSVAITQKPDSIVPPVTPLLILAVPIVDAVAVMTKRIAKGKSPFYADKTHIHHLLLLLGYCKKSALKLIFMLSALFSVFAITGTALRIPEYYLFALFAAYVAIHFVWSFNIKKMLRQKAAGFREHTSVLHKPLDNRVIFSKVDQITGLLNRKALIENLASELKIVGSHGGNLSVVLCDVDHFERINTVHGRDVGDRVINHLSGVIRESLRVTDIAGRFDSDEFMLILPETSSHGAWVVIEKMRELISGTDFRTDANVSVPLTMSFGHATVKDSDADARAVIEIAEGILNKARHGEKGMTAEMVPSH